MNRRQFLTLCAMATPPICLAACQTGSTSPVNAMPGPIRSTTATPTPTNKPVPTAEDWSTLAGKLKGTLVRPDNATYSTARLLFNTRFDTVQPAGIAYCTNQTDIQACLTFAQHFAVPLAIRAGGHSYAGYSTTTGLVLDVTRMDAVTVDNASKTATIGAGARLIDVYAALAQQGLALPAGSCPTVSIAGLTLGGGVGVLGRKFGLTCDNLLSAQVVLADGRILICDATHDADLFWALRGGGGGNFGVVTAFTFQVHPVSSLVLFTLNWPWSSAAAVVDAWQNWAPQAPDELWSNCLLLATNTKNTDPLVRVNGVYVGSAAELNSQLQQLMSKISTTPTSNNVSSMGLLNTMLYEAGCYGDPVNECHLPSQNPNGQLQRDTSAARSDYYKQKLTRQGITTLVNAIANRQASAMLGAGGIGLDAFGGALNRVAKDATAFVHRDALFSAQYSGNWNVGDTAAIVTANRTWLNDIWQSMRQYASTEAYQNYIDPDLPDWQHAYYGSNLPRLQHIKSVYDPGNFFNFAQSIPPAST